MLDISKSALIIIANIYLAQWRPSEINIGHTIQKASEMSFSTANHTLISHKLCISVRHRKKTSFHLNIGDHYIFLAILRVSYL